MSRRALFLDRDGTLIVDQRYPRDPELVQLLPGVAEVLREMQRHWLLVIVSNQSGIARGIISAEEATAVHDRMVAMFAAEGVAFAGVYYCPHMPGISCDCRKPSPGMLHTASRELGIDLKQSVMIGDKASDVEAGRFAGLPHLIRIGSSMDAIPCTRCDDWVAALGVLRALT
jgi:D-glycero-D-manno-heptose 1,7-bisphosphate phosphatase